MINLDGDTLIVCDEDGDRLFVFNEKRTGGITFEAQSGREAIFVAMRPHEIDEFISFLQSCLNSQ